MRNLCEWNAHATHKCIRIQWKSLFKKLILSHSVHTLETFATNTLKFNAAVQNLSYMFSSFELCVVFFSSLFHFGCFFCMILFFCCSCRSSWWRFRFSIHLTAEGFRISLGTWKSLENWKMNRKKNHRRKIKHCEGYKKHGMGSMAYDFLNAFALLYRPNSVIPLHREVSPYTIETLPIQAHFLCRSQ